VTWPLLILGVFLAIGLRQRLDGRKAQWVAMLAATFILGYAYLGLGVP
jgi:uncharacterized MAPEG superfamily protein